jgi:hypothetical protein
MTFFLDKAAICMRKMGGDIPHDPGPLLRKDEEYMESFCLDCGQRIRSQYQNVATVSAIPWTTMFIVREWP